MQVRLKIRRFLMWLYRLVGFLLWVIGLAGLPDDWRVWTEEWHMLDLLSGDLGRWLVVMLGTAILLWSWDVHKRIAEWWRKQHGSGEKTSPTLLPLTLPEEMVMFFTKDSPIGVRLELYNASPSILRNGSVKLTSIQDWSTQRLHWLDAKRLTTFVLCKFDELRPEQSAGFPLADESMRRGMYARSLDEHRLKRDGDPAGRNSHNRR